jgi:phosphoserine aminotransferase
MTCVEDYLDALQWVDSIGGLTACIKKSEENLKVLEDFVDKTSWLEFLTKPKDIRSNTSVCFVINDLSKEKVKKMVALLDQEGVAYDISNYKDAPDGLRIWCGATVDKGDLQALTHWLQWAHDEVA